MPGVMDSWDGTEWLAWLAVHTESGIAFSSRSLYNLSTLACTSSIVAVPFVGLHSTAFAHVASSSVIRVSTLCCVPPIPHSRSPHFLRISTSLTPLSSLYTAHHVLPRSRPSPAALVPAAGPAAAGLLWHTAARASADAAVWRRRVWPAAAAGTARRVSTAGEARCSREVLMDTPGDVQQLGSTTRPASAPAESVSRVDRSVSTGLSASQC